MAYRYSQLKNGRKSTFFIFIKAVIRKKWRKKKLYKK